MINEINYFGAMECFTTRVGEQSLRFFAGGGGSPLLLLPASPGAAEIVLPLAAALTDHFRCLAPDLPGTGHSHPLAVYPETMTDYAGFYRDFLDTVGLDRVLVYGTATGAQIAVRLALA